MPKRGRRRKKRRTHVVENEKAQSALVSSEESKVPKSLVIRRGKTEREVMELVDDVRQMMMPYTALHFREDAKNRKMKLTTYVKSLALPMGVTHILEFKQSDSSRRGRQVHRRQGRQGPSPNDGGEIIIGDGNGDGNGDGDGDGDRLNLRLARTPDGPTMTFRVSRFSLGRHVRAIQRRPISIGGGRGGGGGGGNTHLRDHPPIVVTNNFGDVTAPPHVKLMRITFQNMFPAINVATVRLSDCRRVVLFNLLVQNKNNNNKNNNKNNKSSSSSSSQTGEEKQEEDDDDDEKQKEQHERKTTNQQHKQRQGANDDLENHKKSTTKGKAKAKAKANVVNDDDADADGNGNAENDRADHHHIVEVRHYAIKATPVGIDRKVRRILQTKLPNLNRVADIADYITGMTETGETAPSAGSGGNVSDSEPEDDPSQMVVLPQSYTGAARHRKRGMRSTRHAANNTTKQKSALKLIELGPRLALRLVKVERGLGIGDVMYHAFVHKDPMLVQAEQMKRDEAAHLKQRRREEQQRNVERKRRLLQEKRERRRNNKRLHEDESDEGEEDGSDQSDDDDDESDDDSDDDSDDEDKSEQEDSEDDEEEDEDDDDNDDESSADD